jgi:hypothetical protein
MGIKNGVQYYLDSEGNPTIPSETSSLIRGIRGNPESVALKVYNSKKRKWETITDTKDRDDFNAGEFLSYEQFIVTPDEETGYPQLLFRVVDKDEKVGTDLYKISLNDQRQVMPIANDFMNLSGGDITNEYFALGYRLLRSNVASSFVLNKGKRKEIEIPMVVGEGETETLKVIRDKNSGYGILDPNGNLYTNDEGESSFHTDEEVLNELFSIQADYDPILN